MRIDKWLKVSRILKRRAVSKELAVNERIEINGRIVKPSHEVNAGDVVGITFGNRKLEVRVLSDFHLGLVVSAVACCQQYDGGHECEYFVAHN